MLHAYGADGAVRGSWMQGIRCQIMEGGTGDLLPSSSDSSHRTQITFPGERRRANARRQEPPRSVLLSARHPLTTVSNGMVRGLASVPDWKNVKGFHGANDVEKPGDWNTLECLCDHDRIVIAVNGKVVNAAIQVNPVRGRIALVSMGARDPVPVHHAPAARIADLAASFIRSPQPIRPAGPAVCRGRTPPRCVAGGRRASAPASRADRGSPIFRLLGFSYRQ